MYQVATRILAESYLRRNLRVSFVVVHPSDDDVAVGRPLAVFVPSKDDIAPFLACLEASPHLIEGVMSR